MYRSDIFYPILLKKEDLHNLEPWQLCVAAYHFKLEIAVDINVGYVMTKDNGNSPNIIQSYINGKLSTGNEFSEAKTYEEKIDSMSHLKMEQQKLLNILYRSNDFGGWYNQFRNIILDKLPKYKILRAKIICKNLK